jgi:WD40 repeat protein/tRNA A-37 threonylcarbamoyl transferase component Bud32
MDEMGDVSGSPSAASAGDRYQLKHKIAAGGMGVVWAAEDTRLRRTVALKMMRGARFAEEVEMARFEIEAAAAAALDHPHIVPVYEVGRLEGQPYFTMKLIDGASLAERIKERGRLPAKEAAHLLGKIARAVHHAHTRGVLHRDLKPGNILLDADGEPWLTDFGLAKVTASDSGLTVSSDHLGTPHYMAPETAAGRAHDISTASDIWALGVILWEMLCGQRPFTGAGGLETMRRIVEEEPVRPSSSVRLDGDLMTLAQRCLEKSPSRRPASAGEVADEVDRWLRGEPLRARRITPSEALWKWVRRKPVLAALYAALAVGTVTGFALWRRAEKAVVSLTATNDQLNEALRVSTATKLAGDARLQVEEEPTRALLLAVAAVEMTEKTSVGILPEAFSSLTSVLQKVGGFDASALGVQESYDDGFLRLGWQEQVGVRISPDGRHLLTLNMHANAAAEGARAALFDVSDGQARPAAHRWQLWPESPHQNRRDVQWLPDSRHLAALDDSGEVIVWDPTSPSSGKTGPARQVLESLARPGWELRWQALIPATSSAPLSGAVVWRSAEGTEEMAARLDFPSPDRLVVSPVARWPVALDAKHHFHLSPDGCWLCLTGDEKPQPLRLFSLSAQGPTELPPFGEPRLSQGVQFSADGRLLALSDFKHHLEILSMPAEGEVAPVQKLLTYEMTIGHFSAGQFSPDGRWYAVTGRSGAVVLYPTQPGTEPVTLQLPAGGEGMSIAFSGNGRLLGVGSRQRVAYVWRMAGISSTQPPCQLRGMPVALATLAFSEDGRLVVASGVEGRAARRWALDDANEGAVPFHLTAGTHHVAEVAVSPDGRWLAAGTIGRHALGNEFQGGLVTLASPDGKFSCTLGEHGNRASGVAFSRDGRWLASTGDDTNVKLWDVAETARRLAMGQPPPPAVHTLPMTGTRAHFDRSVAFHPRGTLYGACGDGILFEWDLAAADPAASVQRHALHSIQYLLPDVKISPDGRWMAVARHGWDKPSPSSLQAGNQVLLYEVSHPGPPVFTTALTAHFLSETRLSFSSDSRWLAAGSAGSPPDIWDLHAVDRAGSRRSAPVPQQTFATAFSPDGRWLALGGADGAIHLWNWLEGDPPRSLQTGHAVKSLAWLAPDRLVVAGDANHLNVWDFNTDRLKALARQIAERQLGEEEQRRFRVHPNRP